MLISKNDITTLVFFLDNYFSENRNEEVSVIERLSASYNCVVISNGCKAYARLSKKITIYRYEIQLPNISFQCRLRESFSARIENILYISDSLDFIYNARTLLSGTVLINRNLGHLYKSYSGKLPDTICYSLLDLEESLYSNRLCYYGEDSISNFSVRDGKGRLLPFEYKSDFGDSFPIIAAGRYFGSKHFLSSIDCYSYALLNNKAKGKLFGKFDNIFVTIWSKMFLSYINAFGIPSQEIVFCNVPDKPSKDKFSKIVKQLSSSVGIGNINQNFICIKDYPDNKEKNSYERRKNISGNFSCLEDLSGKTVFLIDDIVTTGATLSECVSVLKESGAKEVIAFVLGINQCGCDYPIKNSAFISFKNNNKLRFNSKSLKPFFSHKKGTVDFSIQIGKLLDKLNGENLSYQGYSDEDLYEF